MGNGPNDPLQLQRQMEPQHMVMEPVQIEEHLHEHQMPEMVQQPLHQEAAPAPVAMEPVLAQQNKADKRQKTPEQVEEQKQKEQKKRLESARRKDRMKKRKDDVRHGFYKVVGAFVKAGRWLSGADKEARNSTAEYTYQMSLMEARDHMLALKLDAELNDTMDQFREKGYAEELERLERIYQEQSLNAKAQHMTEEQEVRHLTAYQVPMPFAQVQRANVVGGTKPAATRHTADGTKWLMKEGLSCINMADPSAPITTAIGYQVQKLVHPDTAIEAVRGEMAGKGMVSYQRMVAGVKKDVDLFRFSRTPEALDTEEMARVQQLAPQILREHTTDWLLCNFDTKGENFLIAGEQGMRDRVYGIDKEAAFRPILDPGAQHMSKDYQRFDQDTVYNQLFRKFADGTMEFDLSVVEEQIKRVEMLNVNGENLLDERFGDATYMSIFEDYIRLQQRQNPDKAEEIERNILRRKQNLRHEYREFFGSLVRERCQHVSEEEKVALIRKYLGGEEGGMFIFESDTPELLQRERARLREQELENQEERQRKAEEADAQDQARYNRRHALYDFSKGFVMGIKSLKSTSGIVEERTTMTPISRIRHDPNNPEDPMTRLVEGKKAEWRAAGADEAEVERRMQTEMVELRMGEARQIKMGGTKPMSQYIGSDGSEWLAKQAVNCMGYYKISGAILTEAGAKLQMAIHPETAVEAFVGRTKQHGDVSFQRRLQNVEGRDHPGGKLDLFQFSKHPELADDATIASVEELAPQILREHTTDWLLCNFDTKGENFVITRTGEANETRVLHGIDKEAAFNKILEPEAQRMSRTYKPHANNTLYNVMFTMYAENKMDFDLTAVVAQVQKMDQMADADYMALFTDYTDYLEQKKPDKAEQIKVHMLRRKTELRQTYEDFFTQLVNDRCKHLHPEEARALRIRYFGEGGNRFVIPRSVAPEP